MAIDLPASPAPAGAEPFLRQWGSVMTPFLGGPEQLVNRLGSRFGLRVSMPPLRSSSDGRLFVSRLVQAKLDVLRMRWPLGGFDPGSPGAPKVASAVTAPSTVLPLKGLTPGYQGREGQFFSVIRASRRYIHMLSADFLVDGAGNATAAIFPMTRVSFAVDDVVELAQPVIEGFVLPGEELDWQMSIDRLTGISFSIVEAA